MHVPHPQAGGPPDKGSALRRNPLLRATQLHGTLYHHQVASAGRHSPTQVSDVSIPRDEPRFYRETSLPGALVDTSPLCLQTGIDRAVARVKTGPHTGRVTDALVADERLTLDGAQPIEAASAVRCLRRIRLCEGEAEREGKQEQKNKHDGVFLGHEDLLSARVPPTDRQWFTPGERALPLMVETCKAGMATLYSSREIISPDFQSLFIRPDCRTISSAMNHNAVRPRHRAPVIHTGMCNRRRCYRRKHSTIVPGRP